MAKQTIKGFIVWELWDRDVEGKFCFQPFKAIERGTGYTQVPVCEHTIEYERPDDFDPRQLQVAAIDAQITAARADFAARITELQEQKNKLLCLEMAS
jgi:hypothetical protein